MFTGRKHILSIQAPRIQMHKLERKAMGLSVRTKGLVESKYLKRQTEVGRL